MAWGENWIQHVDNARAIDALAEHDPSLDELGAILIRLRKAARAVHQQLTKKRYQITQGAARPGAAWPGRARHGAARQGMARQGKGCSPVECQRCGSPGGGCRCPGEATCTSCGDPLTPLERGDGFEGFCVSCLAADLEDAAGYGEDE